MDANAYYRRPYVEAMLRIFGHPNPQPRVTQVPLDGYGEEYQALIKKQWHEISSEDWWNYLNDLSFVTDLQQDLFDFVFPAFLITWREGLEQREHQPASESELFGAIHRGRIFERMMGAQRRADVEGWMAEAFCSEVDSLLPKDLACNGRSNREFFLWTLNAIGQSIPIIPAILERLKNSMTPGKARYWIVLASGLCYAKNQVPWIGPRTQSEGGGGVYVLESHASIYDAGFLADNLESYRLGFGFEAQEKILRSARLLSLTNQELAIIDACLERMHTHERGVRAKMEWYFQNLSKPDLGCLETEPAFF